MPPGQGCRASKLVILTTDEMAFLVEMVVEVCVDRCELPVFFLGAAGVSEPARFTLDLLSWPVDGNMSYQEPTVRFLSALTGGFLLGWGVTIWCLGKYLYPIAPKPARVTVVYGLLSWFVLDSAGSLLSGNQPNVVFNMAVLLVAVGPLWKAGIAEQADGVDPKR